ncbi:patatin-like phospholipase domain-containing protein [Mycolicibacterium gadium]|uniref:Patatin-like phospholipase family protein n=1 Tax=Mycolicibacterium gadium TaxID=1794 RepID=A0ABT6GPV9_MYCGU|nr:patatin-like phospholipase family protein [Mycolicibacterium gadium]MDG5483301.1 patatin-like phospholipase family protein [Mycolicibacterium gadium]
MTGLPFDCDLVLKGGITSGVVYPTAIVELARDHRFHNIGGASAGAIAAVAAAAAEYGRQTGGGGFDELNAIPGELAQEDATSHQTLLQRLFVAQPETREYFDLFWQQKKLDGGLFTRAKAVLPTLLRHSPIVPKFKVANLFAFGLPLAAIVWAVLARSPGTIAFAVLAVLVGVVTYLVARVVEGVINMVRNAQQAVAANMHGLVNGRSVGDQMGLTDWLHERIERLAGGDRQSPLTYGDLKEHGIGLVTLTTNLSQSASETFPFSDETWAFRPDDIRKLFPKPVADHLERLGQVATEKSSRRTELNAAELLKLPRAEDIPVLVGARISLSFPVLISAVPLWRLTFFQRENNWIAEYRQVWLSDGGICSNMPVHLFDHPLPSRPTYGINLGSAATGDGDGGMAAAHRNVWRPIQAGVGDGSPIVDITSTGGLLGAVLTTMQTWSDNLATKALGVRDRICTIQLAKGEGGMNLDMDSATITGLIPKGRAAGENLGWMVRGDIPEHVDLPPHIGPAEATTQWTRHRWTRLRSTALGAGKYVEAVKGGWTKPAVPQHGPMQNDLTYAQLAGSADTLSYLPYVSKWSAAAGADLTAGIGALTAVDLGVAEKFDPPPYRRLTLSTRGEPETELNKRTQRDELPTS